MKQLNRVLALSLFTIAVAAPGVMAIPADPALKKAKQPDGSVITISMRGDEHHHQMFTQDGYPLYYDRAAKRFEYAALQSGRVVGSGIQAKDAGMRGDRDIKYLGTIDRAKFMAAAASAPDGLRRAAKRSDYLISDYPTTGRQKALVILFEFSDVKFASVDNPYQYYNDMLNQEGFTWSNGANGSVRDFYIKSSMGLFDPHFVVEGPVTLPNKATYYGSDAGGQDARMGEAIVYACTQLDDRIDFSEYDTDNDGYVDNIYFFYAGGGQADDPNGADYIWPHSATLAEWGEELVCDGKKIGKYACSNELRYDAAGELIPAGIGTFVHEFGHVLGLIDHYDTSYGFFTFGLGSYDTMASGSYNNNMHTPPLFSAFERAELGWLDYTILDNNADTISVMPSLDNSNMAYRVNVPGADNEFFVIENRQKQGFDAFLPGHGMLVWHIDQDHEIWQRNQANTDPSHQRIDIVEADGVLTEATRTGDTFPGTGGITQYQLASWGGANLVRFGDVTEEDGDIRLLLDGTSFIMPSPPEIIATDVQDSSMVITWGKVDVAKRYLLSVYTTDGEGNKTYINAMHDKEYMDVDKISVTSLLPSTTYNIEVRAGLGEYLSDATSAQVTTKALAFEKRVPGGLEACDVSSGGFTASWNPVEGATDYAVTLYRHGYAVDTSDKGYDFTGKYDGMPALWNTSSDMYYSVSGYYGSAAPSLRFSNDGDYLIVAYPETKIQGISFWCRARKDGEALAIEQYADGRWQQVAVHDVSPDGETVTCPLDGCQKVRIVFRRGGSFVVIDDVVATGYSIERHVVDGYNAVLTGGDTSFSFTGLEPSATYSYRVRALQGGAESLMSDECLVELPVSQGISAAAMPSAVNGVYTLGGVRVHDGGMRPGVYVRIVGGKAKKTVVK